MLNKKGFTLIEVLISSVILFFAILTVNAAYKQYASYRLKQQKYENIYMAVLSLVNKIDAVNVYDFEKKPSGIINGFNYKIKIKKIASKRNYFYSFNPSKSGNSGKFLISLYMIKIIVANRTFILYKTEYKKVA